MYENCIFFIYLYKRKLKKSPHWKCVNRVINLNTCIHFVLWLLLININSIWPNVEWLCLSLWFQHLQSLRILGFTLARQLFVSLVMVFDLYFPIHFFAEYGIIKGHVGLPFPMIQNFVWNGIKLRTLGTRVHSATLFLI